MAQVTSSFYSPYPGTLEMTLEGNWYLNGGRDAGFPSSASTANVLIRGYCGPPGGSRFYCPPIDRYAPVSVATAYYPGNQTWPYGTEMVGKSDGTGGGPATQYGFNALRIKLALIKK